MCAWKCHHTEECTHWGLEYGAFCELWTNVTGRKLNEEFSFSGNKACAHGSLGVGKEGCLA